MTREANEGMGEAPLVNETVGEETLMKYLDGELSPEERRKVDVALSHSTELRREMAIFEALRNDLRDLSFDRRVLRDSIWGRVNQRLTRPMGWALALSGLLAWVAYLVYEYLTSAVPSWQKMATSAVVIGVLLLFASVIYERYREFLTDPYRNVER